MKMLIGMVAIYICVVDKTTNTTVIAETVKAQEQIELIEFPRFIIPCNVKEGDMFYFLEINGVVEVRCGEPEPS